MRVTTPGGCASRPPAYWSRMGRAALPRPARLITRSTWSTWLRSVGVRCWPGLPQSGLLLERCRRHRAPRPAGGLSTGPGSLEPMGSTPWSSTWTLTCWSAIRIRSKRRPGSSTRSATPRLTFCDNISEFLAATLRPGIAGSVADHTPFSLRSWRRFPTTTAVATRIPGPRHGMRTWSVRRLEPRPRISCAARQRTQHDRPLALPGGWPVTDLAPAHNRGSSSRERNHDAQHQDRRPGRRPPSDRRR